MGVRGTFFVTPFYYEEVNSRQEPADYPPAQAEKERTGNSSIRLSASPENGAELSSVSPAGQLARIGKGREILGSSGFTPLLSFTRFFRTSDTFSALDKLGFLYGSIQDCLPLTLRTASNPAQGRICTPATPGLRSWNSFPKTKPAGEKLPRIIRIRRICFFNQVSLNRQTLKLLRL